MFSQEIVTAAAALSAFLACLGSIRAAIRHPLKRWIYVLTAMGMAYYTIAYAEVLLNIFDNPFFSVLMFRPVASLVFVFIFVHSVIDGRRRNV